MSVPEFNEDGNLAEGIHLTDEVEFLRHFAMDSPRRKWLGERLQEILSFAKSTGKLERMFVWGSFVSAKESPNDVDLLLIRSADFQLENVSEDCRSLEESWR